MRKKITKEVLNVYDKYYGDFGLLDEPWARNKDRDFIGSDQSQILGNYIDKLTFLKVKNLSDDLRSKTVMEIQKLEQEIDQEVIDILKSRLG